MTLRYVYGQDETVARFVAQLIPHVDRGFPVPHQTIGIVDANDRLIAGAVYYFWNKRNETIEVATAALPNVVWFTRETMRRMADFAFVEHRCQMAIMRVRAENERLLGQLARFGCTRVDVPRLYGRNADGVMCLLTAEAYAEHPALRRKEMRKGLDYVYGQDEIIAQTVAQMIPHVRARGFGKCTAIGVIDGDGKFLAGIVYHDWNPEAAVIMVSAAALPGTRWLTRETVRRVYEYPFEQLGAQMAMHVVLAEDERLLRQLKAIGCTRVDVPRMFGVERDGVLCLLTREAWQDMKFIRRPMQLREAA